MIILSLQPDPYKKIIQGRKKYEFRRKFLSVPTGAFIYVSSPVKEIRAYIEFDAPIIDKVEKIASLAEQEGSGSFDGIFRYMKGLEKGYAIPILSIKEIAPLSLEHLRNDYRFTAPQSYTYLETNKKLQKTLISRLDATF